MKPYLNGDGWLRVAYDGPELAVIEIETPGSGWQDAYLDYESDGTRVAQIPWKEGAPLPALVNLRVDGAMTGWYSG